MNDIKFSIIIPVYNVQDYVAKCIESIMQQTYKNFEIIVVDDGSTDDSKKIVKNFSDKRIKIISKENGGLSSARNEGLKHINGDYIWFIDSDDYIEIDALELLYNKIKSEDSDIIVFRYFDDFITSKKEIIDSISWEKKENYPLINVSACVKIFKSSFFLENKFIFKEGVLFEDLEMIPFVIAKTNKISFLNIPLYNYVQRNGSIIRNIGGFKKNRDDRFIVLESLINRFKKDKIYEKYSSQIEFLVIRHLIFIYTEELFNYEKDIYIPRFKRIKEFVESINYKYYKNKFIKKTSIKNKIYLTCFRLNMYYMCKIMIKFKKKFNL